MLRNVSGTSSFIGIQMPFWIIEVHSKAVRLALVCKHCPPKYIMNLCMSVHRAIISASWKTSLSNPFCLSEKMYERPLPSWSSIPMLIALTLPTAKTHSLEPLSNFTSLHPPISLSLPEPLAFPALLFSELRLAGARWCAVVSFHPIKWREC